MSFIKDLNNLMYSAIETWFVVALTPPIFLAYGAFAVVGLFIPDSWMNDRATARMHQYLTKEKSLPDPKSLDSSSPQGDQLVEQQSGDQQSGAPNFEGDGSQEISPEKVTPAEEKAENNGVRKGPADRKAEELRVCTWCGGKYEPSAGCDCGGSLFESPHNKKINSEGENKPPILRWFDKVGASFKLGKPVKDSSASPSDKKQKEVRRENIPEISAGNGSA